MKSEEPIKNFKMKDGDNTSAKEEDKPVYIQEYMHQSQLELYLPPLSDAHLIVEPTRDDIIIQDQEFYVAITLSQLERSGIQMPLLVAKVTENDWRLRK